MSLADLHTHTKASDGLLTPTELVDAAAARGVQVLAITDHDSTEGVAEALAASSSHPGFTVIPGVEMSTDVPHGEIHVVGFFVDHASDWFQQLLSKLRESRVGRAEKMVEKLANLGIHLEWQRVLEIAGAGSVGRPHIAQAMVEKGYVGSFHEAFDKYIGRDGPAYAERYKLSPAEAVGIIVKAGGLPALAHPRDIENLEEILSKLVDAGLVGMEVYYSGYSSAEVAHLLAIANTYGLVACGGSDFHGFTVEGLASLGEVDVPLESAQRLINMVKERKR